MSTSAITSTGQIHATGEIASWDIHKGFGFIRSKEGTFFAHVTHFIGDCACGFRHKCKIEVGMKVEFVFSDKSEPSTKFPRAKEIKVKS